MAEATGPPSGGRPQATLSGELAQLLVSLSAALQKFAMYPADHPALRPTVEELMERLQSLLRNRSSLSLGVARDRLVIEGIATDPEHPLLRSLAGRMHRHQIGALSFTAGARPDELRQLLGELSVEADRTDRPIGARSPEELPRWEHVRLHPMHYDHLTLTEGEAGMPGSGRFTQLWIELARAAMASEAEAAPGGDPTVYEPRAVAGAIELRSGERAYDQAIVGYLLQIADELKGARGDDAEALQRRISQVISSLRPETLKRLLRMGGDTAQRRRFLLDASTGLAVDAVIDLVQAASDSWSQGISTSLMRLLTKLAAQSESGPDRRRREADSALREQVRQLITRWQPDETNPAPYEKALERMALGAPIVSVREHRFQSVGERRILRMGLELQVMNETVQGAAVGMRDGGEIAALLDDLESAPDPDFAAAGVWSLVANADTVRQLLQADPPDFESLDRLLPRVVGKEAAAVMLDVLSESDSRSVRRGLFSRLATLGPGLGPLLRKRLRDPRWFVRRNMLALLAEMDSWPEGLEPERYLADPEASVRREAMKLMLRRPELRERALVAGLADEDEKVVILAVAAASDELPAAAVPRLLRIAGDERMTPGVRVRAIRALEGSDGPAVLGALVDLCRRSGWLPFWTRLAPRSPVMLEALRVLSSTFPEAPKARSVLQKARQHEDRQIRDAAKPGGLLADGPRGGAEPGDG